MSSQPSRTFNGPYSGPHIERVAFPMGGIGAGMICLCGTGRLTSVSIRHRPEVFNEPMTFAALHVKGAAPVSRVLEGPIPDWKLMFPWGQHYAGSAGGGHGQNFGLPRFAEASFLGRFPFGHVTLSDPAVGLDVTITGWSPFVPLDSQAACLPVCGLEYTFVNRTGQDVQAVFSFHSRNFLADPKGLDSVEAMAGGFVMRQQPTEEKPWQAGALAAFVLDEPEATVDCRWFRGGWFDSLTMAWRNVCQGNCVSSQPFGPDEQPSPGGSLYVPMTVTAGQSRTVRLAMAWHVPCSNLRVGPDETACSCQCDKPDMWRAENYYQPWYAGRFDDIEAVSDYWRASYQPLRDRSQAFSDCLFASTLGPEMLEALAANLSILKSPTMLRQRDGRLWAWEGCCDAEGCCPGSCTHVWNYAQAVAHLLPDLERTLRQTEFHECQDDRGHQNFRSPLPIRQADHKFNAAADGQLGGLMKLYRDWRISGDTAWMLSLWPRAKASLDYCIATWDPQGQGAIIEPHHNTYDIEFWGADGMCTSIYLGALLAAGKMARQAGEDSSRYDDLLEKGRAYLATQLFNGRYFIQRVQRPDELDRGESALVKKPLSPEAQALVEAEGPKYQYGQGCLSDGVIGAWLAEVCGLDGLIDEQLIASHLASVFKHNFRADLSDHSNPQRGTYALGAEAGLLLCSWPDGQEPSLPFVYSNEVWTGIEYQVASHLAMVGRVDEASQIVRGVRSRYDGRRRNPFDEFECGHWYARALSSWSLIQAVFGVRYDAVEAVLQLRPKVKGDFATFFAAASGWGMVGLRDGKPFVNCREGTIDCRRIDYLPA